MSYETYSPLFKFSKSFLFRDIKWYPLNLIFSTTMAIIPASEDRLWELLGVNKKGYVTWHLLFISCKINMSFFFLSFPQLSLTVLMYLILYLGDPHLWDLISDGLRWCWYDNNRDNKHNKCTVLESFWNNPPPRTACGKKSSTKLVPGVKKVEGPPHKTESQLYFFLSKTWKKYFMNYLFIEA